MATAVSEVEANLVFEPLVCWNMSCLAVSSACDIYSDTGAERVADLLVAGWSRLLSPFLYLPGSTAQCVCVCVPASGTLTVNVT